VNLKAIGADPRAITDSWRPKAPKRTGFDAAPGKNS
jgi:hypothetical protein